MQRHLLAIAVILTAATGCDNVAWGGLDIDLRPPPTSSKLNSSEAVAPVDTLPMQTHGPLLLAGLRSGSRATLVVVGELDGDALAPFPDPDSLQETEALRTLTRAGSRWTLFSEGVRAGTLIVDAATVEQDFCPLKLSVSGMVELVPTANGVERLLALPESTGGTRAYEPYRVINHVYDQRVATLSIASAAIPRVGAAFPPDGLLAARQDIQAFEMAGSPGATIAATFIYRDELAIAPPGQDAYSLFLVGAQDGELYEEAFIWYRPVEGTGKGAPSYFNHLDWNNDGQAEILLDVFGSERRWFATLAKRNGEWIRTYQDACGLDQPSGS